jgi:hypothetical protein
MKIDVYSTNISNSENYKLFSLKIMNTMGRKYIFFADKVIDRIKPLLKIYLLES